VDICLGWAGGLEQGWKKAVRAVAARGLEDGGSRIIYRIMKNPNEIDPASSPDAEEENPPGADEAWAIPEDVLDDSDREVEAHLADPESSIPWEVVRVRLYERYGHDPT
jgi:hypothetical protein